MSPIGGKFYWKRLWSCFSKGNFSTSFVLSISISSHFIAASYPVDDTEPVNAQGGVRDEPLFHLAQRSPRNSPGGPVSFDYTTDVGICTELFFRQPSAAPIYTTNDGRAPKTTPQSTVIPLYYSSVESKSNIEIPLDGPPLFSHIFLDDSSRMIDFTKVAPLRPLGWRYTLAKVDFPVRAKLRFELLSRLPPPSRLIHSERVCFESRITRCNSLYTSWAPIKGLPR